MEPYIQDKGRLIFVLFICLMISLYLVFIISKIGDLIITFAFALLPFLIILVFVYPEILFAVLTIPTAYVFLREKVGLGDFRFVMSLFLILVLLTKCLRKSCKMNMPKKLLFPYLFLFVVMALSLLYTADLGYGKEKVFEFSVLITALTFSPLLLFRNGKNYKVLLFSVLLLSLFFSVTILISRTYISPHFLLSFIGSNYIAAQQIIGIALLIIIYYMFQEKKSKIEQLTLIIILLLFVSALIYAGGKMPALSFLLTIIAMFFISLVYKDKQKKQFTTKIFFISLIVLAVFLFFLFSKFGELLVLRFTLFLSGDYSLNERMENAKVAINLFFQNPLLGAGIGSFAKFSAVVGNLERFKYPHNIFLEAASELGLIGLLLFLTLIFYSFKEILSLKKHNPSSNIINVFLSVLIFVFLSSMTYGNINNPLLFAYIGVVYSIKLSGILKNAQK